MVGAMMARVASETVDRGVKARATADLVRMALRVVDLVDREIVVPAEAARVASGADPMVLLAARDLAARMVVLAVDLVVRMVPVAVDLIVVPALAAKVDPTVVAKADLVDPMVPAAVAVVTV